tara:strand:+ start:1348 stop:2355 length:1008 start_codon:yes stop_codon:yes gene_type:complete
MKDDNEAKQDSVDEMIDGVLSSASPRAAPRKNRKEEIYGELRSEWLAGVSSEKRTRRYVISGVAASIVAALVLTLQLNIGSPEISPEAVLVRSTGNGTTVNGRPVEGRIPINAPLRFHQGDVLSTGPDAAIAVAWNELGSLRVSSSSTVVFASNERVELLDGNIYYDSRPHDASGSATIVVDTPFGQIHHVGTQFIASVGSSGVRVSVREGEVSYGDGTENVVVNAGQSAFIDDSYVATFSSIAATDDAWSWATEIAPRLVVDGRSTREIIEWLSRETGRVVVYENRAAEDYARGDWIKGIGHVEPLRAMAIVPFASDLRFKVDKDSIHVELKNQ